MSDLISRQAAIEVAMEELESGTYFDIPSKIKDLPSAQPEPSEITDEQAILHLQSTGWMQNHDREMYEGELRKQLEYNSEGYDSLISCKDIISRQVAIDAIQRIGRLATLPDNDAVIRMSAVEYVLYNLPSAQPEPQWIPCSGRSPEDGTEVFVYLYDRPSPYIAWVEDCHWYTDDFEVDERDYPAAWMPLPEPYAEGRTDEQT